MKESITSDLLHESIVKETRENALKVLKEKMGGQRFKGEPNNYFEWLDEDEIPLIIDAMIEFAGQQIAKVV